MSDQKTTVDRFGREHHPAQGAVTVSRTSSGKPMTLFCSDIAHYEVVRMTINTATRKDDFARDWVHPEEPIVEIELSLAQWGQLISSMGLGSGTPCTIRGVADIHDGTPSGWHEIEAMPAFSRMQANVDALANEVQRLMAGLGEALDELNAAEEAKAPLRERRAKRRDLEMKIRNATTNSKYAAKMAREAAENTVAAATAEIEARILAADQLVTARKAAQLDALTKDTDSTQIGPGAIQAITRNQE